MEKIKDVYANDVQVLAEIILAIETKNNLQFIYAKELDVTATRKVSPHNLYWNADNTKVMLDAFQISGETTSGVLKSFKQFDCKFIKSALILDNSFEIEKGYNYKSDRYKNSILGVI